MGEQRENSQDVLTIALVGDVMLGRLVNEPLVHCGPAYVWGNTLPLLQRANLTIGNLECVITGRNTGRRWSRWPKAFHFRSDPAAVEALRLAGFDCVLLANNHVLDYEQDALLEMLDRLEHAGIPYTGAGRNLQDASRLVLLRAGALSVGVVAYTDNEPGWAATERDPGTNWIPVKLEEVSLGPVRESIRGAREAGAQLVVFSMHWGPNMVQRPSPLFRSFARAVIDAGADVFMGHSAHLFQGIEIYNQRPIIYDAGDFVDDYAVDSVLRNDRSLLFLLRVRAAPAPPWVEAVDLVPVHIARCQVNLAGGQERDAITAHMSDLCAEMGTTVEVPGDRMTILCRDT